MNKQQFTGWIEDPRTMDEASLPMLESILREYPFCQTAGILFLLNLQLTGDFRFERHLRFSAAASADRARIREQVMKTVHPSDEMNRPGPPPLTGGDEPATAMELGALDKEIRNSLDRIEEQKLRLRMLIEEKKNKVVPDEVELLSPGEVAKPLPKDPLLQEFIRGQQDRITPPAEFYDPLEKARKSLEDDDNLASETLAAIYAAQGNVQRAIKIYQKLSLRYPEKSRYFAAQIENLRKRL
jgi:hypothetical protein